MAKDLIKFNQPNFRLTEKQNIIYTFICKKLAKDEPITFEEAKELYIKESCQCVVDGVPHYEIWGVRDNLTEGFKRYPMATWEVNRNVINFITRMIGVLAIKGALKITPQLDFNK